MKRILMAFMIMGLLLMGCTNQETKQQTEPAKWISQIKEAQSISYTIENQEQFEERRFFLFENRRDLSRWSLSAIPVLFCD